MRILITNNTLDVRAGSELYVRDLAIALLKRGHTPIAYSSLLGEVAEEIRIATIPVIDNLEALSTPPDIIHGQHHLDTMTAVLRFPGVPAVYFCHGWLPWEEAPPRFPRILKYVAIDQPCRDRLLLEHAIPDRQVELLLNFVDLKRFKSRVNPLPSRPQRALVFSNYANERLATTAIREACARHGVRVDVVGRGAGNECAQPEKILDQYDIIFARGRSALEALSVGATVIVTGMQDVGPMVTLAELKELRLLNFGLRSFREPITADAISDQIARYDAADATKVSLQIRATAGLDSAVDQILAIYAEVVAENLNKEYTWAEEAEATSAYLRWLATTYKAALRTSAEASLALNQSLFDLSNKEIELQQGLSKLTNKELELEQVLSDLGGKELELQQGLSDLANRDLELHQITNSVGWRMINWYGPIKHRFVLPAYRGLANIFKPRDKVKE